MKSHRRRVRGTTLIGRSKGLSYPSKEGRGSDSKKKEDISANVANHEKRRRIAKKEVNRVSLGVPFAIRQAKFRVIALWQKG